MADLSIVRGYYTYRSFLNADQPVDDFNKIKFAEAEVFLRVGDDGALSGTLAFPAQPASDRQEFMDLSGTVVSWEPLRVRFIGRGRPGSSIADYEYEYDGTLLFSWPSATPPQRVALSGTVLRAKDHGSAKAGATASFVAVKRDFVDPRDVKGRTLIPEAVTMLASREHRLRHTVWHTLRDPSYWWHERTTSEDRKYFKDRGWSFDDPPFRRDGSFDLTNGAGEDFLYMHRRMIAMLREVYVRAKKPFPSGWAAIPGVAAPQFAYKEVSGSNPKEFEYDAENSGFSVPPATQEFLSVFDTTDAPRFAYLKSDRFFTSVVQNLAGTLRSPRVLAQLSLGAYGNLIEFTVHNWMHMRWAGVPRDPDTGAVADRGDLDIDSKWDASTNDYLGNFHSSHVNPIFWKLHGWVDNCIDAWFRAHEGAHPGVVKPCKVREIPWFETGSWVVKADPFDWPHPKDGHGGHGGHGGADEVRDLESVMARLKEIAGRAPSAGAVAPATEHRRTGLLARRAVESLALEDHASAV